MDGTTDFLLDVSKIKFEKELSQAINKEFFKKDNI
jgi:hypothetical protein